MLELNREQRRILMTTYFIVFGGIALFAVLIVTWDLIARRLNRRRSAR